VNHHAVTSICGDVVGDARCHPTASGVVANFTVEVTTPWGTGPVHTEQYKCVAMGKLGAEVQDTIAPGQLVSVNGFMRTSEWADGSGKENHQLIANKFRIDAHHTAVNHQTPAPKPKQNTQQRITAPQKQSPVKKTSKPRRTYGRDARKPIQKVADFRAVVDDDPWKDELTF